VSIPNYRSLTPGNILFRQRILDLLKTVDAPPEPAIPPPGYKQDPRITFLNTINDLLDFVEELQIFVCSFSEAGDQLSQWRGYCPNSYGFSIGFNYSQLKKHAELQKFMLKKCIYSKKQQRDIVNQYIEKYVASVLPSLAEKSNIDKKAIEAFIIILRILPTIKNKCFKEEKEWRLISSAFSSSKVKERMKFRAGKTAIIPYYEFELAGEGERLPIDSIIIGPTPNRDESLRSVKAVLKKQNIEKGINVIRSEIPYREI
jgi:hypothetical protein